MGKASFSVTQADGRTLVAVTGDLDSSSYTAFDEAVGQVPDDGKIIVDLSAMTFLDSRGLGSLVALWQRLGRSGGSLVLAGARYESARALWVTGLVERFTLAPDVPQAERQFS